MAEETEAQFTNLLKLQSEDLVRPPPTPGVIPEPTLLTAKRAADSYGDSEPRPHGAGGV